jgi:predicted GNAT superfamily acetyltransferase
MPNVLEDLASGIVQYEFDSDTEIATVANVSGWLYENLGQVNTYLYTEFSGANANLDLEAQNVLKELYLCNYYTKQARNALRGITTSSVSGDNILSLRDGESAVTFINRNEVSKVYKGLASDCMDNVVRMAGQYNIYGAQPRQAVGIDGSGVAGARYDYYSP